MEKADWTISITDFLGGFAPAWFNQGSYPTYGNRNHAGAMTNTDLTAPNFMCPGPGLANLTNGTEAAAVTTLINAILNKSVATDVTYGVGGAKLYKITPTTVTSDGTWPHTIDKAAVTAEDGEDVVDYQGNLYYTYNHSGTAGDIGKYNLSATFDDDWGSTTPSGAAALVGEVPHQIVVGGNDKMYVTNGRYVCSFDGTTLIPQALDLPTGSVIQSHRWTADRLYMTANNPSLSGSNRIRGSVYIWDGTTDSWETEITDLGPTGGMFVKNGTVFFFYRDISQTGGYKLAYLDGVSVVDVAQFTGALPKYSQIIEHKDFIMWVSSGSIFAFGAGNSGLPARLFQYADGGYSTVGALSNPFGTPMVASTQSTSYKLAQFSGYDTASTYKTLLFDVASEKGRGRVNTVVFNFDALASGASVAWSLVNAQGNTLFSDTISYAKATATTPLHTLTTAVYQLNGKQTENCRIEFDHSSGSTSNPVKIKGIRIYGTDSQ